MRRLEQLGLFGFSCLGRSLRSARAGVAAWPAALAFGILGLALLAAFFLLYAVLAAAAFAWGLLERIRHACRP